MSFTTVASGFGTADVLTLLKAARRWRKPKSPFLDRPHVRGGVGGFAGRGQLRRGCRLPTPRAVMAGVVVPTERTTAP
jgi:hypothetical protein